MTQQAMSAFAQLAGHELWNQNRLVAYVRHGIRPAQYGFASLPEGCDGLLEILPDIGVTVPVGGYQLPDVDAAPWYDVTVPESKNFAGLYVSSATLSSPYNRTVTPGASNGFNLGRLQVLGRTIVVHGFLIAKTCCAAAYGLHYLTALLGDPDCAHSGGCGGGHGCGTNPMEFLSCCPAIAGEDDCLRVDGEEGTEVYVRSDGPSEWERAASFFRRMNGVGVVSAPEVISCRGSSCGSCGACGSVLEVEFTLGAESGYLNSLGDVVFNATAPETCEEDPEDCQITWILDEACNPEDPDGACSPAPGCIDDPLCPPPPLPPAPKRTMVACGCTTPLQSQRVCANVDTIRAWGSSTLVTTVSAGTDDLRNLVIRVWNNPTAADCDDPDAFPDCAACSTLLVSFIPAGGILTVDGENRRVTLECGGVVRSAAGNVTDVDGAPFAFPELTCRPLVVSAQFDCANISADATVVISRVDRDL